MKRDDMMDLLVGMAVVVMGYALFKQFKPGAPGSSALTPVFSGNAPTNPSQGVPFDSANPGALISLVDLLRGTVHDIMTGDNRGETPATVYEIGQSVIEEQYPGSTTPYRNGNSIVRNPDAYW